MLISCAVYQNGKKLADITKQDISDYVTRPDCFVWVGLCDADAAELNEMRAEFALPGLAVEDALQGHQRPKLEEYGDALFAVLKPIEIVAGEWRVGEVDVFVGGNYVLSVRSHYDRGFGEVRSRCEREPELLRYGSGYVLYALMDAVVDRYFPILEVLESDLESIEENIFSGQSARKDVEDLYQLKQKLTILTHAINPLLEAVSKLYGGRVPKLCAGLGDYFRDIYDHLGRLNQIIDSTRDMVVTAIMVNLSMIALQENKTTKRLAAYAALVAIPTMIAGVYGMNFQHMPELTWAFGYPAALGVMAVIDAYLFYRFRKSGWL